MFDITSKNRGAAKKLLTFCGLDSRLVRVMKIDELKAAVIRCVSNGLVTKAQVERALGYEMKPQETRDTDASCSDSELELPKTDSTMPQPETNEDSDTDDWESEEDDCQQPDDDSRKSEGDVDSADQSESDDDGDVNPDDEETDAEPDEDEDGDNGDSEDEDGDGDSEAGDSNEDDDEDEDDDDAPLEHDALRAVLKYVKAGLNVALVGPAGSGKSYIARQVAGMTGRDFYVNGAMLSKYDLIGYKDANGEYHGTPAYEAFVKGGLHCFDELDASAPDAVVAFNGMTDDQPFYTFPDGQHPQHDDYVAIACMNTYGNGASADYVGRYKQDAAAMSRFVKVFIGYDERIEARVAGKHKDIAYRVWALRDACDALGIRHIVSTRMIVQAIAAREIGRATKAELDRDVFFAGLDDAAIEQLKPVVTSKQRERKALATQIAEAKKEVQS